jgi:ribosomal protein L29
MAGRRGRVLQRPFARRLADYRLQLLARELLQLRRIQRLRPARDAHRVRHLQLDVAKVYAVLAQARQELLSGEQARLPCQRRRAQFYL